MNKLKTNKSLLKRFKITKNGKFLRKSAGQNHLRSKKTGGQIRKKRKWVKVHKTEIKKIKQLLKRL